MNTEKLNDFCLGLPGVKADVKWEEHLTFLIGGKMFVITGFTDNDAVTIKTTPEDFEELTEREGIVPSRYLARSKWISIQKRSALKPKEWEHYLKLSYNIIKSKLPKKIQAQINEANAKPKKKVKKLTKKK
jgi:predicted DNA-binding protein (MmcQ/YjbR family)